MTTYSINLEDVDLALLPLRTSYNNFLKKEHYQFEVMKTVTFEVPEPRLLYTCHICAIDMPAAFAREHATSTKHRANARIATIAAQRMCALITALPPPSAQPTALFCANCATVANEDHYNTREHQDAVAHDNLLWDLVKAYAKDDDTKYDLEISNNQVNLNTGIEENIYTKKDDVEFKKSDANSKYNKAMVANSLDNQLTKPIDGQKEVKPTQEKHIAKNSQMNNNLEQNNEDHELTDDINVNISTSSNKTEVNDVVTVKSDLLVEYPYEITSTGQIQCVVCKCRVPRGIRQREEHVKGLRHRRKVLAQNQQTEHTEITDKEGPKEKIKKVCEVNDTLEEYSEHEELTDVITDNRSTKINRSNDTAGTMKSSGLKVDVCCDVCNFRNMLKRGAGHTEEKKENPGKDYDSIEETDEENAGEGYSDSYEETEEEENPGEGCDSIDETDEENAGEGCSDSFEETDEENPGEGCDSFEGTEDDENPGEEYSEHEEFYNNENNSMSNITEANYGNTIANSQNEYPLELTATGHIRCVVCECEIPNHENNRNEHINGWRHRHRMNRTTGHIEEDETVAEDCETNDSFEDYSEDEEFYNNENNDDYYSNTMSSNITEAKYENTIANSQIVYPFEVTDTGHIRCVLCQCKVPDNENNRNEHINGWRHNNMVMTMNRPEESIEEEEENVDHIEFEDSFEEYSDEEEFTDDNTDDNNISTGYITVNSQIEYPYQVTVTGHVRCVICDCQVPSGVQNRVEHINGMRHRIAAFNMNQTNEYVEEEINDSFEEYSEDEEFTDYSNAL